MKEDKINSEFKIGKNYMLKKERKNERNIKRDNERKKGESENVRGRDREKEVESKRKKRGEDNEIIERRRNGEIN